MSAKLMNPAFKYLQHFCIGVDVLTEVLFWRGNYLLVKSFGFKYGRLTFCDQISEGIRVEYVSAGPFQMVTMNSNDGKSWVISGRNIHEEYDNIVAACKALERFILG